MKLKFILSFKFRGFKHRDHCREIILSLK